MQFYAYDRTSSWDTHKVSNEAQWLKIKTYVQKISGATVMRFSDYGRSGGTIEREGFQALREAITASSEERVLLVWRYDRIARNVAVAIEFMSLCEQHHVHIVSLSEPLPQGAGTGIAAQKMFIQLLFIHGEMQRTSIIENIRSGLFYKQKQGLYLSSRVPFGYQLVKGMVKQEPTEAKAVCRLFELYLTGNFGYQCLAHQLNEEGYIFRNKQPFRRHNIAQILKNRLYTGEIKGGSFGAYTGEVESIVTKKQFQQAQQIRESRQVQKKDERVYLLRKKVECPYCQRKLSPKRQVNTEKTSCCYYYYCSNRSCKGIFIEATQVEAHVLKSLHDFIHLEVVYSEIVKEMNQQILLLKKAEQKQRQRKVKSKDRIMREFEAGKLTVEAMKAQLETLTINDGTGVLSLATRKQYEKKLQEILKLKEQPIQALLLSQVARITIDTTKKLTGIYLTKVPENIYREKDII
ncbi:recombinase family protein [Enterococcus rivorum]|uniref:Recombinase family protein n=2 Tax=Enterococcus rivorum TaxID=762845 RepID=A0A1E5KUB4_9ENTE|nr:recombinase family protein [Enterococcus rivorum]MBP2098922.1 DNA invertase Pin-like site-specific DNA recombinase [Enterococcus rivorum]OEH81477.1 hypothetical protein BCR26_04320 [Enterococcus rivorum]